MQSRGVLQAQVHTGNPEVKEFLDGGRSLGRVHAFPQDGQDGALDGLGNGVIGFVNGGLHGGVELLAIGLPEALEGLSHARKDAGKDDAGIAAGPQQHALGNGGCHFGERVSGSLRTGLYGHVHIIPGVSIWDGKDIEVVNFLAVLRQAGRATFDEV